jgi:rhamnose utilization protein RhaD (predicted bifunctional aldolase and dehydrogenase)
MHGKPYSDLVEFVENRCGEIVDKNASSKKMKISQKIISLTKQTLKGTDELKKFNQIIESAKSLTEQKRYYISNYGFSNYIDYVNCKTDTLIKDPQNYDKFELDNIIEWWRKKAVNRYETLKNDGKIRTEIEVWTSGKDIDIIR